MLTPSFKINQNTTHLHLVLHVPYVKIAQSEMYIEGTEFKFYLKPYYLRLHFNEEVIEDGSEKASYDVDSGDVTISIPKKTPGEHFTDLDMITKLIAPKACVPPPKIEVLSSEAPEIPDDFEWEWEQELPKEGHCSDISYGFANSHQGFYSRFLHEYPDLIDLTDPDSTQARERMVLMLEDMQRKFDMEHYLMDYMGPNEYVGDVIGAPFIPPALPNEQELLIELSKTSITRVKRDEMSVVMIGLFDLLFAYLFDLRHTQGQGSVESGWAITRLSSQLSWLTHGPTLHSAAVLSFTRALTFPLYRNFDLCTKVLEDLRGVVEGGKPAILSSLLGLYHTLRSHEFYYLHNCVFVKEYCVWVQHVNERHLTKLHTALSGLTVTKSDLPLPLRQFERLMEAGDEVTSSEEEVTSCDEEDSSNEEESSSEEEESSSDLSSSESETGIIKKSSEEVDTLALDVKSLAIDPPSVLIEELN